MIIKTEEEFKKKNKKYLAARHETDKHIKVTRPGQEEPVLEENPNKFLKLNKRTKNIKYKNFFK